MQLLSLVVRRFAEGPGAPVQCATDAAAWEQRDSSWRSLQVVLGACLYHLENFAAWLVAAVTSPPADANLRDRQKQLAVAVVSTMLRTDLMPALGRVSAAAAAAAVASHGSGGSHGHDSLGGDDSPGMSGHCVGGCSNGGNCCNSGSGAEVKVTGTGGTSAAGGASGIGGAGDSCGSAELRAEAEWGRRELQLWSFAVDSTCNFLLAWRKVIMGTSRELCPASLRLQLLSAIQESRLLEHTARAVLALLGHQCLRDDVLVGTLAILLVFACTAVPDAADVGDDDPGEPGCSGGESRPLVVAASSPDLQHLLLLHILAQLCAVDGGPSYGLPPGAALPALTSCGGAVWPKHAGAVWPEDAGAAAAGGAATGAVANTAPVQLRGDIVSFTLHFLVDKFAYKRAVQPCSPQALWHLCMRLCAAADRSWEALRGDGGGGGLSCLFDKPSDFEVQALELLVQLTPAVGGMRDLWLPLVRFVRRAMASPGDNPVAEAEGLLTELQLPYTSIGRRMPAEPPADVTAALASGFVPCLELTLRRLGCVAGQSAETAAVCLRMACKIMCGFRGYVDLLAYGEPRELASAIATGAKVLRRGLMEALRAGAANEEAVASLGVPKASQGLKEAVSYLEETLDALAYSWWEGADVRLQDRHWWRRRAAAAAPAAAAAAAAAIRSHDIGSGDNSQGQAVGGGTAVEGSSGRSSGDKKGDGSNDGNDGRSGGGSRDGSGHGSDGRLPPLQQQMLLASWTLAQWLPVLAQGALAMPDLPVSIRFIDTALMPWVPPIALAYLDCRAAAVEATAAAAAPGSPSEQLAHAAAAAAAHTEAESWRHLLFQGMDLVRLFAVKSPAVADLDADDVWDEGTDLFLDALLHVAVAFPEETRLVLCAPVGDSRRGLTLLQALQPCGKASRCEAVLFFHEVITMVGSGRQPGANVLARLRSCDYRVVERGTEETADGKCAAHTNSALLAAPLLLPAPCVAAALLRLPLCANPGCTNLEGDSEAGLRLFGCGRCRGAVAYCSKECQVAHWRAGHKRVCMVGAQQHGVGRDGAALWAGH